MAAEKKKSLVNLKLDMLEDERNSLVEAVDAYISSVKLHGEKFVSLQDADYQSFTEVSNHLENAMTFINRKSAEFRQQATGKSHVSYAENNCFNETETSGSMSFDILSHSPSRPGVVQSQLLYTSPTEIQEQNQIQNLQKQLAASSSKLESLSSTLVKVIADLNSIKKQGVGVEEMKSQLKDITSRGLLTLQQEESFVEMKKSITALTADFSDTAKSCESVNKNLSTYKNDNTQTFMKFEKRVGDLENKATKSENRTSDFDNRIKDIEDGHNKMENKLNFLENRISETDNKLGKLEEKTAVVIDEKEKEIGAMKTLIVSIEKHIQSMKEDINNRRDNDIARFTEFEIKLRNSDKDGSGKDIKQSLKKVEESLKIMKDEKKKNADVIGTQIVEISRTLDLIKGQQSSLEKRLKAVEEARNKLPLAQQLPLLKVGARVRRGPNWTHGQADGLGLGVIVRELPYDMVEVRWDSGTMGSYRIGGLPVVYEIELA
ncbi:uncharacterized protein LOC131957128 [Physella acuta]|uniref:uncharacterized protein LOC131957128 n=1 Tax=Physella acuta TaxID=109671 RepID=UPI0027DCA1E3|nr:uncharacterized protein LOC131957128 [Physella acuta]